MKTMKSWKTTLVGALLAAFIVIQPLLEGDSISWKRIVGAGLVAFLSYLVKDKDVTGGTTKQ